MEVGLTAEQEAFGKVASQLAAELAGRWDRGRGPDTVQRCVPPDDDWARIADAGWLAIRVPEEAGGLDGSCVDTCVLAERLGYHQVPAPVLGTLLAQEQLRLRGADPGLQGEVAAGERRIAPVLTTDLAGFSYDLAGVAVDTAGVPTGLIAGAELRAVALGNSRCGADLTRELASLASSAALGPGLDGADIRAAELAFALTVVSADMLGVMSSALDAAVAHVKLRKQFGVPIGSFQALQHLLAECLVSVEATRSAVWYAAWAVDELPPAEALSVARATKAFASAAVIDTVEANIQVHGGIGMTWEAPAHIAQRRAHLDRRLFGDEFAQYRELGKEHRRGLS